jgi:hypothetical protein
MLCRATPGYRDLLHTIRRIGGFERDSSLFSLFLRAEFAHLRNVRRSFSLSYRFEATVLSVHQFAFSVIVPQKCKL